MFNRMITLKMALFVSIINVNIFYSNSSYSYLVFDKNLGTPLRTDEVMISNKYYYSHFTKLTAFYTNFAAAFAKQPLNPLLT